MSRNKETKNLVVGLDIGTSKIVAIVGEVKPDGMLEVIGMGMHESDGMKKGMVVDIEKTVGAIQRA
ncbi:MAG: cell division protein FtsA, partial [Gallionella sp.]|nr:cell division protein FtsA [Gallionella sp.]